MSNQQPLFYFFNTLSPTPPPPPTFFSGTQIIVCSCMWPWTLEWPAVLYVAVEYTAAYIISSVCVQSTVCYVIKAYKKGVETQAQTGLYTAKIIYHISYIRWATGTWYATIQCFGSHLEHVQWSMLSWKIANNMQIKKRKRTFCSKAMSVHSQK